LFKKAEKKFFKKLDVIYYLNTLYEFCKLRRILFDDYQLVALKYVNNDEIPELKMEEISKKELFDTV